MNYDDLSALLRQSRDNNHKLGITGMLVYQKGTFMQLLEGDRQVVLDLYHRISRDNRHTAVHTVLDGEIRQRNFADWSMGFFNMDKAGDLPGYSDFLDQNLLLRAFGEDAHDAYEFMVSFSKLSEDVTDVTC